MKIIDFARKGNVIRFYLGHDNLKNWYGDDWDDRPYEHNAGTVYNEYVADIWDVAISFDSLVLEPRDDWHNYGNSEYSKDDMKARKVPCIIIVPPTLVDYEDCFSYYVAMDGVKRIYFGDDFSKIKDLTFAETVV